jgi:hypothetical protein
MDERFRHNKYLSLFCREVGCRGTSVDLIPTREGLKSYFGDEICFDESGGILTWEQLEDMLRWAKKKKLYVPK